jgi:hypothetical protein
VIEPEVQRCHAGVGAYHHACLAFHADPGAAILIPIAVGKSVDASIGTQIHASVGTFIRATSAPSMAASRMSAPAPH